MVKIAIIDYGLGNLRSIRRGLEKAAAEAYITHRKEAIRKADGIVLPGVGAFEEAIKNLKPLSEVVREQIKLGKPLLGVCLGLQLLFTVSTEGGLHKGLDIFKGKVVKFPSNVKTPHMGWNTLKIVNPNNPLVKDLPDNSYVYFVHSYYGKVEEESSIIAKTTYGVDFPSILSKGNVFATQFHPERSASTGIHILKNFVDHIKS
ncbi:imidazole glycerol phosphate synthase subunit HisH [Candidatus Bathyarchaeota archaeon]|nr:imidazole glycerol phosphate synthase subunit HisH [Candidatus Bathyarchaeota archaeon]